MLVLRNQATLLNQFFKFQIVRLIVLGDILDQLKLDVNYFMPRLLTLFTKVKIQNLLWGINDCQMTPISLLNIY
jgi:hypothetical protein